MDENLLPINEFEEYCLEKWRQEQRTQAEIDAALRDMRKIFAEAGIKPNV